MHLSVFELIMLIAFGLSWPFSIHKSWTSRRTAGKSALFLIILLIGYASGIAHKVLYSRDIIILFYALNMVMVAIDLALFYRNRKWERQAMLQEQSGNADGTGK